MERKKIIYVIGAGRSGTTLLDVALGNAVGVRSCGELNRYPVRKGIPTGFDLDSPRISFWKNFTEELKEETDLDRQTVLHDRFEYHSGFLKLLLGRKNADDYKAYQGFLRRFYEKLFNSIPESVIIDSSKYPGRAFNLSKALADTYDISYIYIKRDPISVVKSFAKKDVYLPPKSWGAANLYYFLVNNLCKYVIRRLKKRHKVVEIKYEELIQKPESLLEQIQSDLGIGLSEAIEKISHDRPLKVGELFEGNSMRINEHITLRRSQHKSHPKTVKNGLTRAFNIMIYN